MAAFGRTVLFSTPHGSHLYGLAHAGSDRDHYTVVTRLPHVAHNGTRARYARQTIRGDQDTFVIDLSTWLLLCTKGVPQALEAMWSTTPEVDLLGAFRASYRAGPPVLSTYLRTIRSFAGAGDFKRRRHAARLALNAHAILCDGRFNPRLTAEQIEFVNAIATDLDADALVEALDGVVFSGVAARDVSAPWSIPSRP